MLFQQKFLKRPKYDSYFNKLVIQSLHFVNKNKIQRQNIIHPFLIHLHLRKNIKILQFWFISTTFGMISLYHTYYILCAKIPSIFFAVDKLYSYKLFNYFLSFFTMSRKPNCFSFKNDIRSMDFINFLKFEEGSIDQVSFCLLKKLQQYKKF